MSLLEHPKYPTYFYSPDGLVFRIRDGKTISLQGTKCGRGYRAISFVFGDRPYKREYIHRTICTLFKGKCPDGYECRHLDGKIHNNAAENLEWGTPKENQDDKKKHGTTGDGQKNPMAALTTEKVVAMREMRASENLPYWVIAKKFSVSAMTAFRAITKQSWRNV